MRTIVESWNRHPEARLTALNILNRVEQIWGSRKGGPGLTATTTTSTTPTTATPVYLPVSQTVGEDLVSAKANLLSPESTGATDLDSEHNLKQFEFGMDIDSGCVSGGLTTDPENSTSWQGYPARAFRNSYPQVSLSNRIKTAGNETSISLSSDGKIKTPYSHTPRLSPNCRTNLEGASACESTGGYDAQKSSSESSSSDAAIPSVWPFPKPLPRKFQRPRSADLRRFSGVYSETSM